jgi:hypothetical protein
MNYGEVLVPGRAYFLSAVNLFASWCEAHSFHTRLFARLQAANDLVHKMDRVSCTATIAITKVR